MLIVFNFKKITFSLPPTRGRVNDETDKEMNGGNVRRYLMLKLLLLLLIQFNFRINFLN